MKSRFLYLLLCALPLLVAGCKSKSSGGKASAQDIPSAAAAADTATSGLLPDSLFFMLRDKKLPQSVDLGQDISRLSYNSLRLLRSYVYAVHGHWFMEGELNAFFTNHTDWYGALCWSEWDNDDPDAAPVGVKQPGEYWKALEEDYPRAYTLIELSEEERAFVERIDRRMAALEAHRTLTSAEGLALNNPALAVNLFQMYRPDTSFMRRLETTNIALQPSNYLQLFNTYEANDYSSMPSFITTDVMLQATHTYFGYVLKSLETQVFARSLEAALWQLLKQCHTRLSACPGMRPSTDMDNAVYCAVGLALLGHEDVFDRPELAGMQEWLAGAPMQTYRRELELVKQAEDAPSPLFRTKAEFPYSLFKPRGHYTRNEAARRYFRAMMWLQRGSFHREDPAQLAQAVSLASLINEAPSAAGHLERVNRALNFLIGLPDNVSILSLARYMKEQNLTGSGKGDEAKIDAWLRQQFATHNRIRPKEANGPQDELNLMPGRYTFDGEVLGTLYDPEPGAGRAYPSGLDVMDVMGIAAADSLVRERNSREPWAGDARERRALRERATRFTGWDNSLYDKWMHTLVALQRPDKAQPPFMQTRAWQLKNLNSSLASWALLRHDALLYAEQPIAAECGGAGPPDPEIPGYVEPNLPFWRELESLLTVSRQMLERNGFLTELIGERCKSLEYMVKFCREAAEKELAGKPLSAEEHLTIRKMGSSLEWFTLSVIDPDVVHSSWNEIKSADRFVAQVADVFTRNITGCPKDGILYQATGFPHDIYVVVEIEGRFYLTRGAVYSYYEFVRPLDSRLTDEQWQEMLFRGKAPATPEWFAPLVMPGGSTTPDERFLYSTGC